MVINIILLIIFFCSLGGVLFIVSQKLSLLANIDLSQIPEERVARVKRNLLEKRMSRQAKEIREKLKMKLADSSICIKNIFEYSKDKFLKLRLKALDFFKKMR